MDAKEKRHRLLWWVAGSLLVLVCVGLIGMAYRFSWSSTGFVGKTVWDWLQLLVVPLVLAFGAVVFNQANTRTERQITLDKQREDLLQNYLDRMSELLLEKDLRVKEVRNIARVRTISTLIQLDATRAGYVFAFLHEAGLMESSDPILSLRKVNLSGVDLSHANLSGADLRVAQLSRADLSGADLSGANLLRADLSGADLSGADLSKASLLRANLLRADVSGADLSGANLLRANLKGAIIEKEKLSAEQQAQAIWT